ncbi:hypothetical protein [Sulfitobacter guttiformis]|uniref:hypothetical protein n=1 Tax=Sulfitobacter guttiformis TaxID=74349 RepID=UPI000569C05F|nr:hypothetical protein [Sulfitobacter guttiformis]KIN72583.1 PEBP family protein [Sulfitobacter guttiformis KCTC 32187]
MTRAPRLSALSPMLLCCIWAGAAIAQETITLTSPAIMSGGDLPSDLKCSRGGGGLSPPLAWSAVPEEMHSLGAIMQHNPRGKVPGTGAPCQC